MHNAKHTPGPWSIIEHNWSETSVVSVDKDNTILTISIYDDATEETQEQLEAEMAANAHLIAAAPELLEAIQGMCDAFQNETVAHQEAKVKAILAINKALNIQEAKP